MDTVREGVIGLGGPRPSGIVVASDAHLVVVDVRGAVADLVTVDALARLVLAARRFGRDVQLRDTPRELRELLAFMGLSDVVANGSRLRVELQGQAEEREEALHVEEEAELDDPTV